MIKSMKIEPQAAPIRKQTLAKLRLAIIEGRFKPDERLYEKTLCELMGVSRTSVRESLRQLETEGLVKIIPSKAIIKSGESITYTYVLENNGKTEIVNINLLDNKFGIIASGFSLKKGETKTFFKVVTLTETTTNLATATATYQQKNKMKTTEANAIATIEVEK